MTIGTYCHRKFTSGGSFVAFRLAKKFICFGLLEHEASANMCQPQHGQHTIPRGDGGGDCQETGIHEYREETNGIYRGEGEGEE